MKNYIQKGSVVTLTVSAAITSGVGLMTGNLFGVAAYSGAAGDDVEFQTDGVFDLAKDSSSYAAGDAVYWDDENSKASAAGFSAGMTRVGVAIKAAATGDATVRVRLDGMVTRQYQL